MDDENDNENEDGNNLRSIEGGKRTRRKKPVAKKKEESTIQHITNYLNMPMHEITVGDALLIHAYTTLITISISLAVQGYIQLLTRTRPVRVVRPNNIKEMPR